MCGLAGFAGLQADALTRFILTTTLGQEIDDRGGHGIGFVAVNGSNIDFDRNMSEWRYADLRFVKRASTTDFNMLHARYATCGKKTPTDAHPFLIERDGKPILYGMHNGMIDNARESAAKNGRAFTVDSLELLELLADEKIDEIAKLEGYGTLVWIRADDLKTIRMVRMTDHADLHVSRLEEGGCVYGSTSEIVQMGLDIAGLTERSSYKLDVGQVYGLQADGLYVLSERVTLADRWTVSRGKLTGGKSGKSLVDADEGKFTREMFDDWFSKQTEDDRTYLSRVLEDEDDDTQVVESVVEGSLDEDYFQDASYEFIEELSEVEIASISEYGVGKHHEANIINRYGEEDSEYIIRAIHKALDFVKLDVTGQ